RHLALEPWWEAAHRQVMRLLAQRGQRAAALAQYQRCRQVLAEELQMEPDAETTALYAQIERGDFDRALRRQGEQAPTAQQPTLSSFPAKLGEHPIIHNLPLFPTPLVGRAQALAEIDT